jgi:hypothetical protein
MLSEGYKQGRWRLLKRQLMLVQAIDSFDLFLVGSIAHGGYVQEVTASSPLSQLR